MTFLINAMNYYLLFIKNVINSRFHGQGFNAREDNLLKSNTAIML